MPNFVTTQVDASCEIAGLSKRVSISLAYSAPMKYTLACLRSGGDRLKTNNVGERIWGVSAPAIEIRAPKNQKR